jgi:hypothetical protein
MARGFDIGQVWFTREVMQRTSRNGHGLVTLFPKSFQPFKVESAGKKKKGKRSKELIVYPFAFSLS